MNRILTSVAAVSLCIAPAFWAGAADKQPSAKNIGNAFGTAAEATPLAPEIVQDYEPSPAIWLLQDDDTQIFMFGTIHLLPQNFRWRTERFNQIVSDVDELVVETSDDDLDGDMQVFAAQLLSSSAGKQPTSSRMSAEAGKKWLRIAELSGLPEEKFDSLHPLFAMIGVGLQFMTAQGSDSSYGVESVLEPEFLAAGKPVGSIENGLDILKNLLAVDDALLIDVLERDLAEWDGKSLDTLGISLMADAAYDEATEVEPDPFADEHLWARGEIATMADLGFGDTPYEKAIEKVLLEDRNRAWAIWLEQRMNRPGSILLAVGAAHLAGDVSVQAILKERGLTVTRIQ